MKGIKRRYKEYRGEKISKLRGSKVLFYLNKIENISKDGIDGMTIKRVRGGILNKYINNNKNCQKDVKYDGSVQSVFKGMAEELRELKLVGEISILNLNKLELTENELIRKLRQKGYEIVGVEYKNKLYDIEEGGIKELIEIKREDREFEKKKVLNVTINNVGRLTGGMEDKIKSIVRFEKKWNGGYNGQLFGLNELLKEIINFKIIKRIEEGKNLINILEILKEQKRK